MAPKVLISDKLSPKARDIFVMHGVDVDVKTDLSAEELEAIIADYDGLAIRSATKVRDNIIDKATNLKVVGRAGIGVDNVDIPAATAKGIVVMNTPFGNSVTTAEHAIAMMFAVARQIPEANASTHAGKWEKSRFMGVEVTGKTLGLIGWGNIGSIVASRALGLKMKVAAFDPFLTDERALELGVSKVSFEDMLSQADFITIHTPLNDKTRSLINADAFAKMKDGVRIINCARGGIIDEASLKVALENGKVAGAALDVFEVEPAKNNPLFGMENVICTPHLGASTSEAQENVALQVAEQISDFLMKGAVTNALNMPSLSAEDAVRLKPYLTLAEQLGKLVGQVSQSGLKEIKIGFEGALSKLNTKPLSALIVKEILAPRLDNVNMVNASMVAKDRSIKITESLSETAGDYTTALRIDIVTEERTFAVCGTLFGHTKPRLLSLNGVEIEAELGGSMLYIENNDAPGFIGSLGTLLAQDGINIAHFNLGRRDGKAIALISVDQEITSDTLKKMRDLDHILQAQTLVL